MPSRKDIIVTGLGLAAAGITAKTGLGAPPMDITLSIVEDPDGMNLSGIVTILVTAKPNPQSGVEFYIDGVKRSTDTSSPFEYKWDTRTAADGTHVIKADAVYKTRRSTAQMAVTVNNTSPTPNDDFSIAPSNPQVNQEITFQVLTPDAGVTYTWDRTGDGQPDHTGTVMTFTYVEAGTKTVSLYRNGVLQVTKTFEVVSAPQPTVGKIGISFGAQYVDAYDATKRQRALDHCKAIGARVIRHQRFYAFPAVDQATQQVIDNGLRPLLCVMPAFSNQVHNESQAETYGREAATRWGVAAIYEYWNEPDLTGTWTPEQYADGCVGFYRGVKAVTPNAEVYVGALFKWQTSYALTDPRFNATNDSAEWVKRMYARWASRGITSSPMTGISLHLYGDDQWQSQYNGWWQAFGPNSKNIRAIMNSNGDSSKPIISTEDGHNVTSASLESAQVNAVNCAFNAVNDGRLAMQLVYNIWDDNAGMYGLWRGEGVSQRPAWFTYRDRAAQMASGQSTSTPLGADEAAPDTVDQDDLKKQHEAMAKAIVERAERAHK